MILLLLAALLLLVFLEYQYFGKEICAAPVLFTAPFIVMCLVAFMCANQWNFYMRWNTFFVILGGNVTFALGAIFAQKVKLRITGDNNRIVSESNDTAFKYLLILLLQCVCYLWKLRMVFAFARSQGVNGGLSEALAFLDYRSKFTSEATIRWPDVLELGLEISTAAGYVMACILAAKLLQKDGKRKNLILVLMNFAVSVLGGLTSGSRGVAVRTMIVFLVTYLVLFYRQKEW